MQSLMNILHSKTPIGLLHRVVCIYIPSAISSLDSRLFDGRLVYYWNTSGSYIFHENHPLVLVNFLANGSPPTLC